MEYNNDPKLIEQNIILNARIEAQSEVISELRRMIDFMSILIKNLSVTNGNKL